MALTKGVSLPKASMATAVALRAAAQADAVRAGLKESLRLEAARTGEKVQRLPSEGPVRLRSRDGLKSLLDSGSLTMRQAEAGAAYRYCLEEASTSGAGSLSGLGGVGGRGGASRSDAELHRVLMRVYLNKMERAAGAAMEDGRELLVLRMIAGEAKTLTSLASGGNAKDAWLKALVRALDAIDAVLPMKGLRIRDG